MSGHRKKLLIDFDGVLHEYRGWQGPDAFGPPIENARRALFILEKDFQLVVFSTRPKDNIERWLKQNGFPNMKVTNIKEAAFLIIDDRALTFQGAWTEEFLAQIKNFKPHWE
jgi:hypothetical protein